MFDYTFFTVEQYDTASVLTWTESIATRNSHNRELRVELQAFVLTAKLNLDRLFEIQDSVVDAIAACEEVGTSGGQHD